MKEVKPLEKDGNVKIKTMKKSKAKVEQDYARNAIHDYETGKKKQGNYEKKKELEVAAGEGFKMKGESKSPLYSKGSFMSKHCKSSFGSPLNKKSCSKY